MIPTSHGTEERVTRLQGGSTLCPKNQNNLQWVQNAMAAKKGAGARGAVWRGRLSVSGGSNLLHFHSAGGLTKPALGGAACLDDGGLIT
jgi:hypothetical protein